MKTGSKIWQWLSSSFRNKEHEEMAKATIKAISYALKSLCCHYCGTKGQTRCKSCGSTRFIGSEINKSKEVEAAIVASQFGIGPGAIMHLLPSDRIHINRNDGTVSIGVRP